MKKYTLLAALAFSALTVTATPKENTSQGNPQEMDKFITELMGKMTGGLGGLGGGFPF